jgi:hypothetical protein
MLAEMIVFGNVLLTDKPSDFVITGSNYQPTLPGKRPAGWAELQAKRVLLLEKMNPEDEETCRINRPMRLMEVRLLVSTHSHSLILGAGGEGHDGGGSHLWRGPSGGE